MYVYISDAKSSPNRWPALTIVRKLKGRPKMVPVFP